MIAWFKNWFNEPQVDLEDSITELNSTHHVRYSELAATNARLVDQVKMLEAELAAIKDPIAIRAAARESFAVDYKSLNAFAIERQLTDKGTAYTTIGWLSKDGETKEWYFYCDQDTHEELVKQFITWRDS